METTRRRGLFRRYRCLLPLILLLLLLLLLLPLILLLLLLIPQAGDLRLLSDLLSEEGLPLSPDHCYPEAAFRTLLHQALETGHLEAVRIILGGGASPSHYNPTVQVSPLHVAVAQGSKEAVSILLSALNNTNLEPRDRVGRTPLLLAASKGSPGLACLQLLLQAGASPHPVDSRGGQGALQLAAQAGCWEAVDALAAKGATATKDVKAILEQKFGVGKVAGLQLQESQEGLEERLEAELDRAQLGRSDLGLWRQLLGSCSSPSILDQVGAFVPASALTIPAPISTSP